MLDDFDFDLLDDPDFKEDSVREEIIVPILKKLGYRAAGNNKIIRSKNLTHPFVYIGSTKKKISIIPDYLLEIDGEYKLILDAKSPKENVLKGKNPEQAFSYSIHPDVRVKYYSLCNGREFVVFDISKIEPIIHVKIPELNKNWSKLYNSISPIALTKPHMLNFKPDLGLSLFKSGVSIENTYNFVGAWVYQVAKLDDENYSIGSGVDYMGGDAYAISFDFNFELYEKFLESIPRKKRERIKIALSNQPFHINLLTQVESFEIIVQAVLGGKIYTNDDESYMPMNVINFDRLLE